jgi:hypothetical protein
MENDYDPADSFLAGCPGTGGNFSRDWEGLIAEGAATG